MRFRDLENCWRYRKVVRNPWTAATARRSGRPGDLVALELRRGGRIFVRSGTADIRVFQDVFVKDVYGLSAFEGRDPALDCVLDIGGHIGLFSIRASSLARRVLACEPVAQNVRLFRENVEAAGCTNVWLEECAVTRESREARVFRSASPERSSTLASLAAPGAMPGTVRGRTLSELFEEHEIDRCDFLKVDCEGGEYEILLDAPLDLLARVGRIALEYHDAAAENPGYTGVGLERSLASAGFSVRRCPSRRHRNHGLLFAWRPSTGPPAGWT